MKRASGKRSASKSAKLSSGTSIELDGDLVFLVDTLYRDVALRQELGHTYEDIKREIEAVYEQMESKTRKEYFLASVFLNYVTYENEMIERVTQELARRTRKKTGKK